MGWLENLFTPQDLSQWRRASDTFDEYQITSDPGTLEKSARLYRTSSRISRGRPARPLRALRQLRRSGPLPPARRPGREHRADAGRQGVLRRQPVRGRHRQRPRRRRAHPVGPRRRSRTPRCGTGPQGRGGGPRSGVRLPKAALLSAGQRADRVTVDHFVTPVGGCGSPGWPGRPRRRSRCSHVGRRLPSRRVAPLRRGRGRRRGPPRAHRRRPLRAP